MKNKVILKDIYYQYNWNYRRVLGSKEAYEIKNKIVIGIIDSGLDKSNIYIKDRNIDVTLIMDEGYSDKDKDETGHGTQVFGVIDTLIDNVEYKIYKITNNNRINALLLVKSIIKAVEDGVNLINISMGIYKNLKIKEDLLILSGFNKAIQYAKKNNVIIVASSGNNGYNMDDMEDIMHIPSDHEYVISVGSSLKNGDIAPYTNYGKKLDLVAPTGEWKSSHNNLFLDNMIMTYGQKDKYLSLYSSEYQYSEGLTFSYGTSLAVPQVVAVIAIILDKYGFKTSKECIKYIMENGCIPLNSSQNLYEIRVP
ncbi:S8 family serine peptidase [Staphylococcus agnetis]|uniref:S8 family serine peptidase n=1 Tax=Staphylococcus agnetis TaxID=985762 RepID=UPI00208E5F12|nr:S8 family serine peptidase [Staphylococcus agnetis]MCO4327809.1 S8 family serine peptidase [Staphylococcus agnetis]MCO4353494.1 S8 family serine peptidase [Staphylococcus agnetis]MCO4370186.1 S8 family serine peptidase [Staphylococcus agnetis]